MRKKNRSTFLDLLKNLLIQLMIRWMRAIETFISPDSGTSIEISLFYDPIFVMSLNITDMLNEITWSEFFITLLIIGCLYYLFILVKYYRKDLRKLLDKSKDTRTTSDERAKTEADDAFTQASAFKQEVNEVLAEAVDKKWIKQEILMAIAGRAQQFTNIPGTPFQSAIEHHILQQTPLVTQVILEPEEIKRIW